MENENKPSNNSTFNALLLAFVPTALFLGLMLIGSALNLSLVPVPVLLLMCLASIGCCLGSSFMLFRQGTTFAIVGAIVLLLINGFISFGFDCCATMGGRVM